MSRTNQDKPPEKYRPQVRRPAAQFLMKIDYELLDKVRERAAIEHQTVCEWMRRAMIAELRKKIKAF